MLCIVQYVLSCSVCLSVSHMLVFVEMTEPLRMKGFDDRVVVML